MNSFFSKGFQQYARNRGFQR